MIFIIDATSFSSPGLNRPIPSSHASCEVLMSWIYPIFCSANYPLDGMLVHRGDTPRGILPLPIHTPGLSKDKLKRSKASWLRELRDCKVWTGTYKSEVRVLTAWPSRQHYKAKRCANYPFRFYFLCFWQKTEGRKSHFIWFSMWGHYFNPLNPKSDQHQSSPCNSNAL